MARGLVVTTPEELQARMRKDVQRLGSQTALAAEIGIGVAYLGRVMSGKDDPGPAIARHYGLIPQRFYVPSEAASAAK